MLWPGTKSIYYFINSESTLLPTIETDEASSKASFTASAMIQAQLEILAYHEFFDIDSLDLQKYLEIFVKLSRYKNNLSSSWIRLHTSDAAAKHDLKSSTPHH